MVIIKQVPLLIQNTGFMYIPSNINTDVQIHFFDPPQYDFIGWRQNIPLLSTDRKLVEELPDSVTAEL
jgi:hypothetical protein